MGGGGWGGGGWGIPPAAPAFRVDHQQKIHKKYKINYTHDIEEMNAVVNMYLFTTLNISCELFTDNYMKYQEN